eukprot:TRINITY_DN3563_c0_g1_i2.p1 TRINITY_DN3563_c0_g1~~TRINITY_DN3563_c0_g1_i2.p1  ORF type:complete len:279 (-),score=49.19 TRINITY_DN3563_c0_g1_i2:35-871(-)
MLPLFKNFATQSKSFFSTSVNPTLRPFERKRELINKTHNPQPLVPLKDSSHYEIVATPQDVKVPVVNLNNEPVGEVSLNWRIFKVPLRRDLLHRVVVWQQAKSRQGTKATKGRSEVSGSNKKPYAQKGTGQARAGTLRAPQFRHGGRAFATKPRDFEFDLPKKVRSLALKVALSTKLAQGKLVIVDKVSLEEPKTTKFVEVMKKMNWRKALLVGGADLDQNIQRAARRLFFDVQLLPLQGLNVYSILAKDTLVLSREALELLNKRFSLDAEKSGEDLD